MGGDPSRHPEISSAEPDAGAMSRHDAPTTTAYTPGSQQSEDHPHGSHSRRRERERLTSEGVTTAYGGYEDYAGFNNRGEFDDHGGFVSHDGFGESGGFENLNDLHVTSPPSDQTFQASFWDPTVANMFQEASTDDFSNIMDLGGFVEEDYQERNELFDA